MGRYQELLKRIDEKNYFTEREHKEFLRELKEIFEIVEKLESGITIIYCGKVIAMNREKYYEYREKQLNSPHAMAFLQDQIKALDSLLHIEIRNIGNRYYLKYYNLEEGNYIDYEITKEMYERLRGINK